MTPTQQTKILEFHLSLPEGCRSAPATQQEIASFEKEFGTIPDDYRWYLTACGGGVVGSEWVDDIAKLRKTHLKFSEEDWNLKGVFAIGWDGAGNPMVIERVTGRMLVSDHNFGGVHVLADSFADFVLGK